MANTESRVEDVSSAKAVLLGALAPGVNGPTLITLKSTFLMLGLCLAIMLGLAFSSSDSWLTFHVTFLVIITVSLFLLLSWFLAQTGFVSIENQMHEMGLAQNDYQETSRKSK
ncbi:Autophagy-related protein 22-1 [Quillaja saponaria]|uniref:Autophagy-related protein 22-1 n=1 Tax=Quillaja saponaria TaxID=32244 RepID=A0AAD7KXM6_QUISA|nr:Autophagy-related protein 22-1 [Quillaja saponaria]